jgi:hypothetical protein
VIGKAVNYVALTALMSAIGLALLVAGVLWTHDYDPFDLFQAIGIESEPGSDRHAVTFRYVHANSSRQVIATWILSDPRPVGSTAPVQGRRMPILVWTSASDMVAPKWLNGRLIVAVPSDVATRRNDISACYFADNEEHLICFDSATVDLVEARR